MIAPVIATRTETIYIASGNSQCRVYAIPYPMRPGQHPRDINYKDQCQWSEIGLLNYQLKVVCLAPQYRQYRDDIEGQMGGTWFEVQVPITVPTLERTA